MRIFRTKGGDAQKRASKLPQNLPRSSTERALRMENKRLAEEVRRLRGELERANAHAVNEHSVNEYCKVLWQWFDLIIEQSRTERGKTAFQAIAAVEWDIKHSIKKSNYLYRRLYLGQAHRTRKCPLHDGRWSGYGFGPDEWCPCSLHGLSDLSEPTWDSSRPQTWIGGMDLTGWLPEDYDVANFPGRAPTT